jgi:NADH-quinone oxidoreductase subunit J
MLTRAPTGPAPGAPRARLIVAAVVAGATAAVLLGTLLGTLGGERIDLDSTRVGTASEMGGALFSGWVLPFEALSVLLLAALIGAIALTRRLPVPSAPSRPRSEEQPADAAGSTAGPEEGSGR